MPGRRAVRLLEGDWARTIRPLQLQRRRRRASWLALRTHGRGGTGSKAEGEGRGRRSRLVKGLRRRRRSRAGRRKRRVEGWSMTWRRLRRMESAIKAKSGSRIAATKGRMPSKAARRSGWVRRRSRTVSIAQRRGKPAASSSRFPCIPCDALACASKCSGASGSAFGSSACVQTAMREERRVGRQEGRGARAGHRARS